MPYRKRDMEAILKKAARQFPAVIVTGPRQSGKTTILKHLFSKTHDYVSLDEPDIRLQASRDPGYFLKNFPPPVIIDGIQYAPELFPYLKISIDNNRSRRGQFLLTGSQSFPLMVRVGESLAGRIAVLSLLSFSYSEQLRGEKPPDIGALKRMALRGGFPEVVLRRNINAKL